MNFFSANPSTNLVVAPAGKVIFTIASDGIVELGEGVSLDEAARAFWQLVSDLTPAGWRLKLPPNDAAITQPDDDEEPRPTAASEVEG